MRAAALPAPIATERVFDDADDMPAGSGAYVLVLDLPAPVRLDIATLPEAALRPGRYLYVGSARGPGGIRARVRRHMRAAKSRHWHIDRLTEVAGVDGAIAFPGGRECDIVRALLAEHGVTTPVEGFGSSDCRVCDSHLLVLEG